MAEQNFPDSTIYQLDNLPVLRGMNSETVDLIATDPPFNTGQIRTGTEGRYSDRWKWGNQGTAGPTGLERSPPRVPGAGPG